MNPQGFTIQGSRPVGTWRQKGSVPSPEGAAGTGAPDFTGQLPGICMRSQSCLTLCDPTDYDLPDSSVLGIFWPGILEWVAISAASIGREEHPLLQGWPAVRTNCWRSSRVRLGAVPCSGPHPSSQHLRVTPSWNFLTATCAYPGTSTVSSCPV